MKTLIVLSLAIAITSNAAPKAPPVMPPMPKLLPARQAKTKALLSPKMASLVPRPFTIVRDATIIRQFPSTEVPACVMIKYYPANTAPRWNSVDTVEYFYNVSVGNTYQIQWSQDLKVWKGLSKEQFGYVLARQTPMQFGFVVGNNTGSADSDKTFYRLKDVTGH